MQEPPPSATQDLDATIALLKTWLEEASKPDAKSTYKERMAISDRLLKALALKYKHTDDGKGSKFGNLGTP